MNKVVTKEVKNNIERNIGCTVINKGINQVNKGIDNFVSFEYEIKLLEMKYKHRIAKYQDEQF